MPESLRPHALTAINRALPSGSPIVLTCRTAEYEAAIMKGDVITAAAVIEAQPVRPDEAAFWLRSGIPPYRVSFWEPVFNHLRRQPDSPLAQALTTPLAVWLVRAVFSGPDCDPAELTDTSRFATPAMIEDYLLDALIPTLLNEWELAPHGMSDAALRGTADDARRYLAFLAAHLTRLGTRDFAWWELHRALHPIVPRLVIGLAVGLFGGLLAEIVSGSRTGVLIGIAAGIISTFLSSSSASPPGYASFRKRSWKCLSRAQVRGAGRGWAAGWCCAGPIGRVQRRPGAGATGRRGNHEQRARLRHRPRGWVGRRGCPRRRGTAADSR